MENNKENEDWEETQREIAYSKFESLLIFLPFVILLAIVDRNTFLSYPTENLFAFILNNIIYIALIIIISIILIFFCDFLIKKHQQPNTKLFSEKQLERLKLYIIIIPAIIVFAILIFIESNKHLHTNSLLETDKGIIISKGQGTFHVKSLNTDSAFILSTSNNYKVHDTIQIEIQKGFFGLPFIKKHHKTHISTQFVYHDFKLGTNIINFAPSNMYVNNGDSLINYNTKKHNQWDICNLHYKKQSKDIFHWQYYAENSTWKNNTWRPITRTEILYILKERPNAAQLHCLASIDNINGLIILPDDWNNKNIMADKTIPTELKKTPKFEKKQYSHNTFTKQQWGIMQSYGAIFLPALGYGKIEKNKKHYQKETITHEFENIKGYYWTSSSLKDENKACCLVFGENSIDVRALDKNYQCAIRLIWSKK